MDGQNLWVLVIGDGQLLVVIDGEWVTLVDGWRSWGNISYGTIHRERSIYHYEPSHLGKPEARIISLLDQGIIVELLPFLGWKWGSWCLFGGYMFGFRGRDFIECSSNESGSKRSRKVVCISVIFACHRKIKLSIVVGYISLFLDSSSLWPLRYLKLVMVVKQRGQCL